MTNARSYESETSCVIDVCTCLGREAVWILHGPGFKTEVLQRLVHYTLNHQRAVQEQELQHVNTDTMTLTLWFVGWLNGRGVLLSAHRLSLPY